MTRRAAAETVPPVRLSPAPGAQRGDQDTEQNTDHGRAPGTGPPGREDGTCRAGAAVTASRRCYPIPPHHSGQRIGLFGGSFNPPHDAHLAACLLAMTRLRLDRAWWLVTPGNPLKDSGELAPLHERIALTRALANHPRIVVTGIEAEIGVRYSYDTVRYLVSHCPGVRFVWIMGADNLRSFHRWQSWRGIAGLVPIAVVDRPGPSLRAAGSVTANALRRARVPEGDAATLLTRRPPAWVLLHGLKSTLSSTALRAAGGHKGFAQRKHDGDAPESTGEKR